MLRTDLTAQKASIIVSNMHFTEAETEAFWPVYRKYNKELDKVGDAKVAVIKDYAAHLDSIDDKKAKELTAKALKVEEQRLHVIKKYIGEFGKVLSAKQVARFFQLEMQMQRMVDLQVAAELPLVNNCLTKGCREVGIPLLLGRNGREPFGLARHPKRYG